MGGGGIAEGHRAEIELLPQHGPHSIHVRNGEGDGRVEDYPGEDFFWGMLAPILAGAGEIPAKAAP